MRYVSFVIIPPDGGLTAVDREFGTSESIERRSIQHLNLLSDGTAVVIFELGGDRDLIEELCANAEEVMDYSVTPTRDGYHAYIRFEPNDVVKGLLEITQEHELVVDTPLVYTHRGGLRVTAIGDDDTFRAAMRDIPDELRLKLEQLGEYEPTNERLFSLLTPRQQEILQEAIEQGYYAVPRQATHEQVGEELGCSGGTVGEHLRKIEATILTEIAP